MMKGGDDTLTKVIRKSLKISIPANDKTVFEWLSNQDNMSMSIRRLIHLDVAKNGYRDILCEETKPNSFIERDDINNNNTVFNVESINFDGHQRLDNNSDIDLANINTHKFDDEINTAVPKPMPKSLIDNTNFDDLVSTQAESMNSVQQTVTNTKSDAVDSDGFVDPEKLFNGF